jgi:hypothetical protein
MVPWSLVFYEECLSYFQLEKAFLYSLLQKHSIVVFDYFYYYTIYHRYEWITPLSQLIYSSSNTPKGQTRTNRMEKKIEIVHFLQNNIRITFHDLIVLFRQASFIPYMIQEPQLYK